MNTEIFLFEGLRVQALFSLALNGGDFLKPHQNKVCTLFSSKKEKITNFVLMMFEKISAIQCIEKKKMRVT